MKKIIAIVSTLSVLASASAFAKTEGNYIGFDLHRANMRKTEVNRTTPSSLPQHEEVTKTGVGISYKHAFNLNNGIFIAPGAFFERIGTKDFGNEDSFGGDDRRTPYFTIKNRYGIKTDFGYDFNDNVAGYVTVGVSRTGYKVALADSHDAANSPTQNNKSKLAMLYGFGLTSKVNDDITLGFEYNTQRFSVQNHDQLSDIRTKIVLDVYKVTLGYHF